MIYRTNINNIKEMQLNLITQWKDKKIDNLQLDRILLDLKRIVLLHQIMLQQIHINLKSN